MNGPWNCFSKLQSNFPWEWHDLGNKNWVTLQFCLDVNHTVCILDLSHSHVAIDGRTVILGRSRLYSTVAYLCLVVAASVLQGHARLPASADRINDGVLTSAGINIIFRMSHAPVYLARRCSSTQWASGRNPSALTKNFNFLAHQYLPVMMFTEHCVTNRCYKTKISLWHRENSMK